MNRANVWRHLSYTILILSPVLLLILLSLMFNRNAFVRTPVWSDEICYWREVFSFLNCGTNTGYYGIQEVIPKIGQFGTHGFFPTLFYLPFAKVLGWQNNGVVISNIVFTMICFLAILYLVRLNTKQTLLITVIYVFYIPIFLYAPTSMTEILNYGLLGLFLALLYKYLSSDAGKRKNLFLVLMITTLTVCLLYRITYLVLFVMPLILLYKNSKRKKFLVLFPVLLIYLGVVYFISALFVAPYPYGVLYNVLNCGNIGTAVNLIWINVRCNIMGWFNYSYGDKTEIFQRGFYSISILLYVFFTFFKAQTKGRFFTLSYRGKADKFYLAQSLLLLLPLVIVITIYDVHSYRDYRVLAPFLWGSLLSLIIFNRKVSTKFMSIGLIAFFIINLHFLPNGFCLNEGMVNSKPDFSLINQVVTYNYNARDPFENTILTDDFNFALWSNLHSGVGIEFGCITENLKSKYLLIHTNTEIRGYTNRGATEFGCLYIKNQGEYY